MFRKSIPLLALLAIQIGCTLEPAARHELRAAHPVTLQQYKQAEGNLPKLQIDQNTADVNSPGRITIGPGTVTIDNIGQGTDHTNPAVREWKRTACRPGSSESRRYPCVTSMPNGDACQIGSCLPADLYRGNR